MNVLLIDSNSELWFDKTRALGLPYIKMPLTIDGQESFYDLGEHTDFDDFYRRVRAGSIPITSALNKFNYLDTFEPYFSRGDDILYLSFSHKLSATFEQMDAAIAELKEKYPARTITVFDSKSISIGTGLQCYYAAQEFNKHRDIEKTVAFLNEFSPRAACYFVVDDLHFLKRGGRLSGFKAVMGTLLGVKPIIKVTDEGKLVNVDKVKGEKRVIRALTDLVKELGEDVGKYSIFVAHADCPDMGAKMVESLREAFGPEQDITLQPVGPVIATHCGPGTLGIAFHAKHR